MKKTNLLKLFIIFIILFFVSGCNKVIEEPLGLPINIGTPPNIQFEPLGLPDDIGIPPDIPGEGYIFYDDCKSKNGKIIQINDPTQNCPNQETNLGRIYDIDCLCICCL